MLFFPNFCFSDLFLPLLRTRYFPLKQRLYGNNHPRVTCQISLLHKNIYRDLFKTTSEASRDINRLG